MGRNRKENLPWITAVGAKVDRQLSEQLRRPFLHFQSGPYTQHKPPLSGIYFNDPVLHHILPRKQGGRTDFRFGFYLDRWYSRPQQQWTLEAGFEVRNPTLATLFLMKNLGDNADDIALQLHQWLIEHPGQAFCSFPPEYQWDGQHSVQHISEQLRLYSQQSRKQDAILWKGSLFNVGMILNEFPDLDEAALASSADQIAETVVSLFIDLTYLYNMILPHTTAPARLSTGQNRALRRVQPNRKCAWATQEHCDGEIEAAHIKSDRVGGRAVGKNLIWLCDFHHMLLDSYFKTELHIDRQGRRIVARVNRQPSPKTHGGIPLTIWNGIEDKNCWPLPLQPGSLSHLFKDEEEEALMRS